MLWALVLGLLSLWVLVQGQGTLSNEYQNVVLIYQVDANGDLKLVTSNSTTFYEFTCVPGEVTTLLFINNLNGFAYNETAIVDCSNPVHFAQLSYQGEIPLGGGYFQLLSYLSDEFPMAESRRKLDVIYAADGVYASATPVRRRSAAQPKPEPIPTPSQNQKRGSAQLSGVIDAQPTSSTSKRAGGVCAPYRSSISDAELCTQAELEVLQQDFYSAQIQNRQFQNLTIASIQNLQSQIDNLGLQFNALGDMVFALSQAQVATSQQLNTVIGAVASTNKAVEGLAIGSLMLQNMLYQLDDYIGELVGQINQQNIANGEQLALSAQVNQNNLVNLQQEFQAAVSDLEQKILINGAIRDIKASEDYNALRLESDMNLGFVLTGLNEVLARITIYINRLFAQDQFMSLLVQGLQESNALLLSSRLVDSGLLYQGLQTILDIQQTAPIPDVGQPIPMIEGSYVNPISVVDRVTSTGFSLNATLLDAGTTCYRTNPSAVDSLAMTQMLSAVLLDLEIPLTLHPDYLDIAATMANVTIPPSFSAPNNKFWFVFTNTTGDYLLGAQGGTCSSVILANTAANRQVTTSLGIFSPLWYLPIKTGTDSLLVDALREGDLIMPVFECGNQFYTLNADLTYTPSTNVSSLWYVRTPAATDEAFYLDLLGRTPIKQDSPMIWLPVPVDYQPHPSDTQAALKQALQTNITAGQTWRLIRPAGSLTNGTIYDVGTETLLTASGLNQTLAELANSAGIVFSLADPLYSLGDINARAVGAGNKKGSGDARVPLRVQQRNPKKGEKEKGKGAEKGAKGQSGKSARAHQPTQQAFDTCYNGITAVGAVYSTYAQLPPSLTGKCSSSCMLTLIDSPLAVFYYTDTGIGGIPSVLYGNTTSSYDAGTLKIRVIVIPPTVELLVDNPNANPDDRCQDFTYTCRYTYYLGCQLQAAYSSVWRSLECVAGGLTYFDAISNSLQNRAADDIWHTNDGTQPIPYLSGGLKTRCAFDFWAGLPKTAAVCTRFTGPGKSPLPASRFNIGDINSIVGVTDLATFQQRTKDALGQGYACPLDSAYWQTGQGDVASSSPILAPDVYSYIHSVTCNSCKPGYIMNSNGYCIPATSGSVQAGGNTNIFVYNLVAYPAGSTSISIRRSSAYTPFWALCLPVINDLLITSTAADPYVRLTLPYIFNVGDLGSNKAYGPITQKVANTWADCTTYTAAQCQDFSLSGKCKLALDPSLSVAYPASLGSAMRRKCVALNYVSPCVGLATKGACLNSTGTSNIDPAPIPLCQWGAFSQTCAEFDPLYTPALMVYSTSQQPSVDGPCVLRPVKTASSCNYDGYCYWREVFDAASGTSTATCVSMAMAGLGVPENVLIGQYPPSFSATVILAGVGITTGECLSPYIFCRLFSTPGNVALHGLLNLAFPVAQPLCTGLLGLSQDPNLCNYKYTTPTGLGLCEFMASGRCLPRCSLIGDDWVTCLASTGCMINFANDSCASYSTAAVNQLCPAYASAPFVDGSGCGQVTNLCSGLDGTQQYDGSPLVATTSGPEVGNYTMASLMNTPCIRYAGYLSGDLSLAPAHPRLPPQMAHTCQLLQDNTGKFRCVQYSKSVFRGVEVASVLDLQAYANAVLDGLNLNPCLDKFTLGSCLVTTDPDTEEYLCAWIGSLTRCASLDWAMAARAKYGDAAGIVTTQDYTLANRVVAVNLLVTPLDMVTGLGISLDQLTYPAPGSPPYARSSILVKGPMQTPCDTPTFSPVGTFCCPEGNCTSPDSYPNPRHPKNIFLAALTSQCQPQTLDVITSINIVGRRTNGTNGDYYYYEPVVRPSLTSDNVKLVNLPTGSLATVPIITKTNSASWFRPAPEDLEAWVPLMSFGGNNDTTPTYPIPTYQDLLPTIELCMLGTCFGFDLTTSFTAQELAITVRQTSLWDLAEQTASSPVAFSQYTPQGYTVQVSNYFRREAIAMVGMRTHLQLYMNSFADTMKALYGGTPGIYGAQLPPSLRVRDYGAGTSPSGRTTVQAQELVIGYVGDVRLGVYEVSNEVFSGHATLTLTTSNLTFTSRDLVPDARYMDGLQRRGMRHAFYFSENITAGCPDEQLSPEKQPYTCGYLTFKPGQSIGSYLNSTPDFDPMLASFPYSWAAGRSANCILGTEPDCYCGDQTLGSTAQASTDPLFGYWNLPFLAEVAPDRATFWQGIFTLVPKAQLQGFLNMVIKAFGALGCPHPPVNTVIGNNGSYASLDVFSTLLFASYNASSGGNYYAGGTFSYDALLQAAGYYANGFDMVFCGNCLLIKGSDGQYLGPSDYAGACDPQYGTQYFQPPGEGSSYDVSTVNGLPLCRAASSWAMTRVVDQKGGNITSVMRDGLGSYTVRIPVNIRAQVFEVQSGELCPTWMQFSSTSPNVWQANFSNPLPDLSLSGVLRLRYNASNLNNAVIPGSLCDRDQVVSVGPLRSTIINVPICTGQFYVQMWTKTGINPCSILFNSSLDYTTYFQNQKSQYSILVSEEQVDLVGLVNKLVSIQAGRVDENTYQIEQLQVQYNGTLGILNLTVDSAMGQLRQNLLSQITQISENLGNTNFSLVDLTRLVGQNDLNLAALNSSLGSITGKIQDVLAQIAASDQALAAASNGSVASTGQLFQAFQYSQAEINELKDARTNLTLQLQILIAQMTDILNGNSVPNIPANASLSIPIFRAIQTKMEVNYWIEALLGALWAVLFIAFIVTEVIRRQQIVDLFANDAILASETDNNTERLHTLGGAQYRESAPMRLKGVAPPPIKTE